MENGKRTKGRLDPRMARALDLHNEGISSIPVDLASKRAVVKFKQYQEHVTPSHVLAEWWGSNGSFLAPKYGIAMLTDRRTVVDIDSYKANTPRDLSEGLEASHTYRVATPRGGVHYYFTCDPELCTLKQPEHGFDIRARGGYVVTPPSKGYKVCGADSIKAMPSNVKEMLTRLCGNGDRRNPDGWYEQALTDVIPRDSERGIHTLAPKMVGKWIGEGISKEEMLQRLTGWCVVNKLGMPIKELARIIDGVHEAHRRNAQPPIFLDSQSQGKRDGKEC
jgi:hypothetical protein